MVPFTVMQTPLRERKNKEKREERERNKVDYHRENRYYISLNAATHLMVGVEKNDTLLFGSTHLFQIQ